MESWYQVLIRPEQSIIEALKAISKGSAQIVLVIDSENRLLGTVTDGDIRQGILDGYSLDDPVEKIMNPNPIRVIPEGMSKEALIDVMIKNHIHQLPLVDNLGRVTGLQTIDELLQPDVRGNLVVIMSGGIGKRLMPLTNDRPKPMLAIGGKPLLEVNMDNLRAQGFRRFCFTVAYKAEMITEYFGDGSKWGVSIDYIYEETPLGTAGSLQFLESKETQPIIVMNGDLLTTIQFSNLLNFHYKNKTECSVCIREYEYQIPYGVIETQNQKITAIKEKPICKYYVNAGIYIINPNLLRHLPKNEVSQMPNYLEQLIELGYKVEAFPLMEYWSDIGQIKDYERACREFDEIMI
jgi:dTDP-glucose pyrophosphorylase